MLRPWAAGAFDGVAHIPAAVVHDPCNAGAPQGRLSRRAAARPLDGAGTTRGGVKRRSCRSAQTGDCGDYGNCFSRSRKPWIFPVAVLGNSATNSTKRGYLYGARRSLTKALSSSCVADWPSLSTTKAMGL